MEGMGCLLMQSPLRKTWLDRLIFSLIGMGALLFSSAVIAEQVVSKPAMSVADLNERIGRVEHGLLLPIQIEGEPDLTMQLADRMQYYRIPGVSIAIINNGEIEWARGYGVSEQGSNKPVTTTTLFQAGSISKPVAAMAALSLVQQGKLELDANVNVKLVSWKVPENKYTREQKVSLRGILSHTAGLTIHGFPGYGVNETIPTLVQILKGIEPANTGPIQVDLTPNRKWRYSGGGYTVMQQLLLDITGRPFPELLEEVVLKPIGMNHSTFRQNPGADSAASVASAHRNGWKLNGKRRQYPEMAAAGLWTTPSDLALFAIELQDAVSGKSNKVLSASMANMMVTPVMQEHGLGWDLMGENESSRFSHGGVNVGFEASMVAYTNTGQGAVVMTNGEGGIHLAHEIIRGIAQEYEWMEFLVDKKVHTMVNPKLYDAYVGVYEFAPNFTLTVSRNGDNLYLQVGDAQQLEIFPESEVTFFPREFESQITFVKNKSGRVTQMILGEKGELQAKRIK